MKPDVRPCRLRACRSWLRRALAIAAVACAWLLARSASAQATYYQVPTSEILPAGEVFVQQQTTLGSKLDLSAQAVVGLGERFEIGVSVYNVDFERRRSRVVFGGNDDDRSEPFGPLALLTLQKRFELFRPVSLALGTQTGVNPGPIGDMRVATRSYANVVVELAERSQCTAGGYVGNGIFLGDGVQVGPWLGCDVEIVRGLMTIMADIDAGNHANAGTSIGPKLELGKYAGIAVGARAPNPWADQTSWGAILQLEVRSH